jgi:hypothetical protein
MTMKRMLTGSLLILLLAAVVDADASLTGKWQGVTRNGTPIALDLTATESALTGTLTRNDETVTITDGKVSKNTFSFKATLNDRTEDVSGELAGEEIKVWLDRQGPDTAIVMKRVKQ